MEISVGFADKDGTYYTEQGYLQEESTLGQVYYPAKGVELYGQIVIRYMEYPWISTFEIDGIRALPKTDLADGQAGQEKRRI